MKKPTQSPPRRRRPAGKTARKPAAKLARATASAAAHLDHDILANAQAVLLRTFDILDAPAPAGQKIGTLTVKVTALAPLGRHRYEITSSLPGVTRLSLYNLAAQGRRFRTTIEAAKGQGLEIFDPTQGAWAPLVPPRKIPKTGTLSGHGRKHPANPDNIFGLKFTGGRCELEFSSGRLMHDEVQRLTVGHDTTPPPPDTGGPDGDQI